MPGFVISVTVIVTVKLGGAILSGLSICPHCSVRLHKSDYVMSVTVTVGVWRSSWHRTLYLSSLLSQGADDYAMSVTITVMAWGDS